MTKTQKKREQEIKRMVIYCTCCYKGKTEIFRLEDDWLRVQLAKSFIEEIEAEKLKVKSK